MTEVTVIDSVVCQCCDVRWPGVTPRFPESWICPSCLQWIEGFNTAAIKRGACPPPVFGPVKSVRRLLVGENVTAAEFYNDTSAWVVVFVHHEVHARMGTIIEELQQMATAADDPDDHIPASKVRG